MFVPLLVPHPHAAPTSSTHKHLMQLPSYFHSEVTVDKVLPNVTAMCTQLLIFTPGKCNSA